MPDAYDAQRPIGLIVLMNYKASDVLPTSVLPQLAQAYVALVVAKPLAPTWPQRVALALDAAHNMRARYAIDPRRVYVIGGAEKPDAGGETTSSALRAGLGFPDVFSGTCAVNIRFYRVVKGAEKGSTFPAGFPAPDAPQLALARQRPFVLAQVAPDDYGPRAVAAFKADGFRHVDARTITLDQIHYPGYTTDWLPDVLKFMDAATEKLVLPATKSTTRPTP